VIESLRFLLGFSLRASIDHLDGKGWRLYWERRGRGLSLGRKAFHWGLRLGFLRVEKQKNRSEDRGGFFLVRYRDGVRGWRRKTPCREMTLELRDTYATNPLNPGVERADIQALLGHSTINTPRWTPTWGRNRWRRWWHDCEERTLSAVVADSDFKVNSSAKELQGRAGPDFNVCVGSMCWRNLAATALGIAFHPFCAVEGDLDVPSGVAKECYSAGPTRCSTKSVPRMSPWLLISWTYSFCPGGRFTTRSAKFKRMPGLGTK
jgi:hypothetical protein